MKPTQADLMIGLIKRTGNPVAPLIMNELANAIEHARGLFPNRDMSEERVKGYQERLLKDFPEEELSQIAATPEFITAMMVMVKTSLIGFTNQSHKP